MHTLIRLFNTVATLLDFVVRVIEIFSLNANWDSQLCRSGLVHCKELISDAHLNMKRNNFDINPSFNFFFDINPISFKKK